MRNRAQRQDGFTLLESMMVVGVMMVLMGLAIFKSFGSMESYQANSASDVVVSQMRVARQLAITQRRVVQVWIDNAPESIDNRYHVKYQVQSAGAQTKEVAGPIVSVPLPGPTQFILEKGVPDTPMNFGNTSAVYIGNPPVTGGPPVMQFNSEGTFTDNNLSLLYGTMFIGIPNQPGTARAVTIMGGTGRVRAYNWNGTTWQE